MELNFKDINPLIKWIVLQLVSSFIMSLIVCFLLIGKVAGFYDPGLIKVVVFSLLFFCFSLIFGLPILLLLLIKTKRWILFENKRFLLLLIGSMILSTYIAIVYFNLDFKFIVALCCSYFPSQFLIIRIFR
jgi:hypothetical protein